jgi:type VI secretion system protein ImpA
MSTKPLNLAAALFPPGRTPPGGDRLSGTQVIVRFTELCEGRAAYYVGSELKSEAVDPDWRTAFEMGCDLIERSADLGILVRVAAAALRVRSLSDAVECIDAIAEAVDAHWADCYPELDFDDDGTPPDASVRLGVLSVLDDDKLIRGAVRTAPVSMDADGTSLPSIAELVADSANAAQGAVVGAAMECVVRLQAAANRIEAAVHRQSPADRDFSLAKLRESIEEYSAMLRKASSGSVGGQPEAADVAAAPGPPALTGRAQAVAAIERAIAYFESAEPSSPVPAVLRRALALVGKDFWDVIQTLGDEKLTDLVNESRLFQRR